MGLRNSSPVLGPFLADVFRVTVLAAVFRNAEPVSSLATPPGSVTKPDTWLRSCQVVGKTLRYATAS